MVFSTSEQLPFVYLKIRSAVLRHRWPIFIALLIVAGLALWWQMTRPLATLVLADGTTIFLRRISVGPEHYYRAPHPPGAGMWEKIRHPFGPRKSVSSISPVLFLTEKPPASSSEHPAVLDNFQRRFNNNNVPISQVGVDRSNEDHTMVLNFNYPRREKTMRLNLSIHGQWIEWELPNPLYGSSFPVWDVQPFPLTVKEGDLEFTATGWTTTVQGWILAGAARYKGKAADHVIYGVEATDATGNHGYPGFLPPGEPAWKVNFTMRAGDREPLSPERLVDFGKARVPADGEHVILEVPPRMMEGQTMFVALVGRGTFAFRNGTYAASELPEATPNLKRVMATARVDENGWRVRGEAPEPGFIMFELANGTATFQSDSLSLRCAAGNVQKSLSDSVSRSTSSKGPSTQLRRSLLTGFPVGTEVSIRSVRSETFKMELVVPPPSPAERALAERQPQKQ